MKVSLFSALVFCTTIGAVGWGCDSKGGQSATTGSDTSGGAKGQASGPVLLATLDKCHPSDLVLDPTHIYWFRECGDGESYLKKIAKKGGKPVRLATVPNEPSCLTVDDKYAYFSTRVRSSPDSEIVRVPLGGGKPTPVQKAIGDRAPDLSFALDEKFLYFTLGNKLMRVPKDGGKPTTLAQLKAQDGVVNVSVRAVDATHVYFVLRDSIQRVAKTGGKAEDLVTEQKKIIEFLAVDETSVFYVAAVLGNAQKAKLKKIAKGGGAATVLLSRDDGGISAALRPQAVYFLSGEQLGRVSKAGGKTTTILTFAKKDELIFSGIAVDEHSVYYAAGSFIKGVKPFLKKAPLKSAKAAAGKRSGSAVTTTPTASAKSPCPKAKQHIYNTLGMAGGQGLPENLPKCNKCLKKHCNKQFTAAFGPDWLTNPGGGGPCQEYMRGMCKEEENPPFSNKCNSALAPVLACHQKKCGLTGDCDYKLPPKPKP